MLATLAGFLALLLGLSLLLLPLVVTELSRPRDSAWGAVVLLLGLVLVTSAERLTGAPMLAVLCGGLLVGRLGSEVAQARWRALSDQERLDLQSSDRWSRSLNQLAAAVASLLQSAFAVTAAGSAWLAERRQGRSHGKRWVRAETPEQPDGAPGSPLPQGASAAAETGESRPDAAGADGPGRADSQASAAEAPASPARLGSEEIAPLAAAQAVAATGDPGVRIVADFAGVDALLDGAQEPQASHQDTPAAAAGEDPQPPSQG